MTDQAKIIPIRLVGDVPQVDDLSDREQNRLNMIRTLALRPNPNPRPLDISHISAVNIFALNHPLVGINGQLSHEESRSKWAKYISAPPVYPPDP